jgi:hypothetical protein
MAFETPILFITFNRPSHTSKVFERIREVKPKYLFVVSDGPRPNHPDDAEKIMKVRELVCAGIDWDCELKTLFRQENLGCGYGPANAITWFFSQIEEGIILEDDCLPSASFFRFCRNLLAEYRDETRVMAVSGFNYFGKWQSDNYDYFFSDGGNWGWASWRRAWKLFDYEMSSWLSSDAERKKDILAFYPDFDALYKKIIEQNYDAWDIQWHYARLYHQGVSITPVVNLVENIGFDNFGTHTTSDFSGFSNLKSNEMLSFDKLKGPKDIQIDLAFRYKLLESLAGPRQKKIIFEPFVNLLRKLKKQLA